MRLALILLLALAAVPAGAVDTRYVTLEHDGLERRALMDVPSDARNAPVLVALHGGLAGPRSIRRRANVQLALEGWVVLWPYAVDDWNDGRTDWQGEPYDREDDIGFLRRLIGELAARGMVDPDRVYFAGPSIGGIMVLRLLCEAPEMVAGAAIAIASLPDPGRCRAGPPVPAMVIHGTEDPLIPPDGGRIGGWNPLVRDRGRVQPISSTLDALSRRNGCAAVEETAIPDRVEDDGSRVLLRRYEGCDAPLIHYVVEGGGHTWPGAPASGLGRRIVGETNRDISATREVEAFFRRLDARRRAGEG